jgi:hypothetical protein
MYVIKPWYDLERIASASDTEEKFLVATNSKDTASWKQMWYGEKQQRTRPYALTKYKNTAHDDINAQFSRDLYEKIKGHQYS